MVECQWKFRHGALPNDCAGSARASYHKLANKSGLKAPPGGEELAFAIGDAIARLFSRRIEEIFDRDPESITEL